jgi:hypothetical protein
MAQSKAPPDLETRLRLADHLLQSQELEGLLRTYLQHTHSAVRVHSDGGAQGAEHGNAAPLEVEKHHHKGHASLARGKHNSKKAETASTKTGRDKSKRQHTPTKLLRGKRKDDERKENDGPKRGKKHKTMQEEVQGQAGQGATSSAKRKKEGGGTELDHEDCEGGLKNKHMKSKKKRPRIFECDEEDHSGSKGKLASPRKKKRLIESQDEDEWENEAKELAEMFVPQEYTDTQVTRAEVSYQCEYIQRLSFHKGIDVVTRSFSF